MGTMSRDKKSKVDDITILRKILDNPSDPGTKQMFSEEEKALTSIYKQLTNTRGKTPQKSSRVLHKFDSLEPKVTIRTKIQTSPQSVPPFFPLPPTTTEPTTAKPTKKFPEFELVQSPAPPQYDLLFAQERLFEVEKIEMKIPGFNVLLPNEQSPSSEPNMVYEKPSFMNQDLPEWQPVESNQMPITQGTEKTDDGINSQQDNDNLELKSDVISTNETIPEFERIDTSSPESQEKPDYWETSSIKEQPIETPVESPLISPSDASFDTFTRKQKKAAKKAEKEKEKEAKRQKKIELKNLKLEARKKEQEALRLSTDEQVIQSSPEQQVRTEQIIEEIPRSIMIGSTAFDGIQSIDEKTAMLLYKNGYFSIENLRDATIDDLVQIQGIRRKLAKQIKNEVQQKTITPTTESEFVPIKGISHKKPLKTTSDDFTEWESYHTNDKSDLTMPADVCIYKNFTLYKKTIKKDKKKTTIHFFSKEKPDTGTPVPLPRGYQITVNKKTGIPYLKKK